MTTEKQDYSDYISYLSTSINLGALFAAFTLTIITLLVTQLPDPSLFFAQVTLLLLAFIFDILLFVLSWSVWFVLYFCERIPPMTRIARIATIGAFCMYQMFGIVIILMFLLLELTTLALAALLMWFVFLILTFAFIYRPLTRFKETRAKVRGY